jgi:predicted TIM-barrel fold metal-dependent hydrolase
MIIDFHVHLWEQEMVSQGFKEYLNGFSKLLRLETDKSNYEADPYRLINDLMEAEIDKAVIISPDYSYTPARMAISIEKYTDYLIKLCDEHDEFIGFVGVDPRHGKKGLELIKYGMEQNLKGLVLTPTTGFYLNDEILTPFYELANELKIPIVIHDFALVPLPFSIKYIEPYSLDDTLMKYPDLTFILEPIDMTIGGNLMSIGMRHISHLFGELSGFSTQYMVDKVPDMFLIQPLGLAKEFYGSENLLFGSNWPFFENRASMKTWVDKVRKAKPPIFLRPLGIPSLEDIDRENILGRNGARILGLKYVAAKDKKLEDKNSKDKNTND